ncbi:MAG TPA: response regulator transcription factor [Burkholderiales bacterium]|nr:response regulator transcription factor [Burkholderiales bacterium]
MTAPRPISTIRVLLVDDHRTVLWGLEKLIESESPAMVVAGKATSGAEAIKMASQARPDVIVLDSELGEQSGIDAIPQLLERSNAKVLLLTEQRNAQLHDRAVLAGARGIVYKEEPAETIVRAIEKVHKGEVWLDRMTTGRILDELSQNGTPQRREQQQDWATSARLTTRERELVAELVQDPGATYNKIAAKLRITEHTVRNHLTSIYSKLRVQNRLELFVYASKNGVPPTA